MSWRAVVIAVTVFCAVSSARADWIHGFFSPQAGIDSINRFLVLSDTRDSTFFGYGIVPAGDINKDGIQDVIVGRSKNGWPTSDDSAFLFLGGKPPSTLFVQSYGHLKFTLQNVGDLNGDGFEDFGISDLPFTNYKLFYGGLGNFDSVSQTLYGFHTRVIHGSDIDGDGHDELILSKDINGGYVYIFATWPALDTIPKYVIPDTASQFGSALATGDFNGDGWPDLAVSACFNRDTEFVKFYWGGPQFDTIADWELVRPVQDQRYGFGKTMFSAGDFNADGITDIYIGSNAPEPAGVHFGGTQIHAYPDITVNSDMGGGYNTLTYAAPAGDVNHDGHPDIVSSFPIPDERIFIHLGGPNADSIPDVVIGDAMIPGFQLALGQFCVTGVGDFNGDGVDDIAAYSKNGSLVSEVNFFAGWNSKPTDVPDDNGSLPSEFVLRQNYPNPFNPSTTIEFEIAKPERAVVRVYNALGEVVRTLVDRQLTVGTHRVVWDGRDDQGREVASGVYLYRLTAGGVTQEKKMVLVR